MFMNKEHERYIIKQGPGKGGVAPIKTEVIELGGENNETQEHTDGTDVRSDETDTSTSR